jgi:hypothetical protein
LGRHGFVSTIATMRSVIAIAILLASIASFAQPTKRIPVVVEHSGKDAVGQGLAFELREGIRGSQGMKLVTDDEASPRIKVHIVSIESNSSSPGTGSSMAIVLAYDSDTLPHLGYLLTAYIQNCGTKRTTECARNILASVDQSIEDVRKNQPKHYELLK